MEDIECECFKLCQEGDLIDEKEPGFKIFTTQQDKRICDD
jgi:hypothetical protein